MRVPEGWKRTTLDNYITIKHGFAFKSDFFTNDGQYVLMTPGSFFESGGFRDQGIKTKYYAGEFPSGYLLKKDDLVIAMTEQADGLLGSAALIPENNKYLHNQRLGLVKVIEKERMSIKFLYCLYNSRYIRKQISEQSAGTKVKHTSPDKLIGVTALIPPIFEQQKIAQILFTWDKAIKKLEALIAAKQKRKKALMQQLLTGKKRFAEFVKSDGMQKTKFGTIPSDWQFLHIAEVAKQLSVKNNAGHNLPVLSCTKHYGLVDSLTYFGRQIFSEDTSTYKVAPRNTFAYATNHIEEGSIGYQNLYDEALISPMYTVFQTKKNINDEFLYRVLKTELYRHIFEANTSASVDRRGSLRWNQFAAIKIPVPSIPEQQKIASCFAVTDKEIEMLKNHLIALKEQKKGLMQKLLTGKLRVKLEKES